MKNSLYEIFSTIFESILDAVQYVSSGLVSIHVWIANTIVQVIAYGFRAVLLLIDRDRVHHAEQVLDQESISNELDILMHVSMIKDDVLKRGTWLSEHSLALNELGQKLYNECDWSTAKIHAYMKGVVETIPGLTYAGSDDEEDLDDGRINIDD